jgi:hypothetical protein
MNHAHFCETRSHAFFGFAIFGERRSEKFAHGWRLSLCDPDLAAFGLDADYEANFVTDDFGSLIRVPS